MLINTRTAKAGSKVSVGDIIEIRFGSNSSKIKVVKLSEVVRKEEAAEMYETL